MSKAIVDGLNEKELACLEHHCQQAMGISFAPYCRTLDLRVNQWYGVRSGLMRKGIIADHDKTEADKPAGLRRFAYAGRGCNNGMPDTSCRWVGRFFAADNWLCHCNNREFNRLR